MTDEQRRVHVLVITDRDNVGVALEPIPAGSVVNVRDGRLTVHDDVPSGHKIALAAMAEGEAVIKYGHPIGKATRAIAAGQHVHTHNLSSTRGRGDLQVSHEKSTS